MQQTRKPLPIFSRNTRLIVAVAQPKFNCYGQSKTNKNAYKKPVLTLFSSVRSRRAFANSNAVDGAKQPPLQAASKTT